MTRSERCMGTVFTLDVRDPGDWADELDEVVAWLHHVDDVFSTYRETSDISRIGRGELAVDEADPLVPEVLDLCRQMELETGGAFTSRPGGSLDPTGLVKGWAIDRASALLAAAGSRNHAVNGGGDMQIEGEQAPGEPWRIGISDPHAQERLVAVVEGSGFAVATSGIAERGPHIVDPATGRPPEGLASVTVLGRSLTRVDAYATAAFAMGSKALDWLEAEPDHEGLVVRTDGTSAATSRFYQP